MITTSLESLLWLNYVFATSTKQIMNVMVLPCLYSHGAIYLLYNNLQNVGTLSHGRLQNGIKHGQLH